MTIKALGARVDATATLAYAQLFDVLSDPTRLAVLQHLSTGEHRVRDLVEHLQLAQSTVSKHLAHLHESGLVRARVDGRASWYALTLPGPLAHLVLAAEQLLEATGAPHSLCSHLTEPALLHAVEEVLDGRRA